MYAFGTVWYELLTGEWPWKQKPPESIIWQVGLGIKPTLANLQVSSLMFATVVSVHIYVLVIVSVLASSRKMDKSTPKAPSQLKFKESSGTLPVCFLYLVIS